MMLLQDNFMLRMNLPGKDRKDLPPFFTYAKGCNIKVWKIEMSDLHDVLQ
jgi:hypothetical protein